jgi:hypothetical protein
MPYTAVAGSGWPGVPAVMPCAGSQWLLPPNQVPPGADSGAPRRGLRLWAGTYFFLELERFKFVKYYFIIELF